jgi:hypothetical protein
MPSKAPLPPISEESFDGEHQSTTIPKDLPKCTHAKVSFINGELRCPCGSAWSGANLHELYTLLHK